MEVLPGGGGEIEWQGVHLSEWLETGGAEVQDDWIGKRKLLNWDALSGWVKVHPGCYALALGQPTSSKSQLPAGKPLPVFQEAWLSLRPGVAELLLVDC